MEIITLNVRGLNNPIKRQTIFHWLEDRKFDIICLQETFCTAESEHDITSDWKGASFHCLSNSKHSKGVSILLNEKFNHNVKSCHSNNDGRQLVLNFEHCGHTYCVSCIYAPNDVKYRKDFLSKSKKWIIDKCENDNSLIICGDFNCSINEKDRKVYNIDRSRPSFYDFIKYLDIYDSYRELNANKIAYTYSNAAGTIQSRIDYIFASQYVLNLAKKSYILNAPKVPDHRGVILKIRKDTEYGPGYWKLNTNLLTDNTYCEYIVNLINDIKDEYKDLLDKRKLWDFCKIRIQEESIKWSIHNAKLAKDEINDIEKELRKLDDIINNTTNKELHDLIHQREILTGRQNNYYQNAAIGAQIRARVKWIEQGEKNTKYFLNLEKKRQTNNKISCIHTSNGQYVYKSEQILREGAKFYSELYNCENITSEDIDKYLDGIDTNEKLTEVEALICEGDISNAECESVLKLMATNKTPGYDGLPSEFYIQFWHCIKDLVIGSFNEAFTSGELSETHKQIIISLIFKKIDRKLFKNYRPISLSNVDYKILAFVLANRLQKVIGKLISPEQVAYIKERYIGQNIRLLLDVLDYTKTKQKPGILLFLDFEKAFDSLNWNFIDKCLQKFGFGENFCRWIKIIYTDPKAFVKINGFLSETISFKRGIRQGCPLSALIFIICTEFMALQIKKNDTIKGIDIDTAETTTSVKVTQYADDTCVYLKDLDQITPCIDTINSFSSVSGLKLNLGKTEGLCIGSLANETPNLQGIKWPTEPIRYLGIYIANDLTICDPLNWTSKLEKMQRLLDSWRVRRLTLQGKIIIIKTLAIPKIVYTASFLPIPQNFIKNANRVLYNFLWKTTEKIKRTILINDYEKGGLKMIDLETHTMALKAAWIPRIFQNSHNVWSYLGKTYIEKATGGLIQQMNLCNKKQFPRLETIPPFYQEVVIGYCKANIPEKIFSKSYLYSQTIWGNRQLICRDKCLFSQTFINSGYIYVKDILFDNGKIKNDIYENLVCKQNYFRTISMIQDALKPYKHLRFSEDHVQPDIKTYTIVSEKCKWFYGELLKQKAVKSKAIKHWTEYFETDTIWYQVYCNKLKLQLETKIAEFNYKLINCILPTGSNLFKWKKAHDTCCIYCHRLYHDAKHLLYDCIHLSNIWENVSTIINDNITWNTIVLGNDDKQHVNLTVSLICFIIYKKFLIDRNNVIVNFTPLIPFVKKEIAYRLKAYREIESTLFVRIYLEDILLML